MIAKMRREDSLRGRIKTMLLHEDRLFPAEASARKDSPLALCRHPQPAHHQSARTHAGGWFADNQPFPDPATLFVQPDHYVFRMLYSQGVSMDDLEIGQPEVEDPRKVWRIFASHYYLFRGTPTRHVAGLCVSGTVRHDGAADRRRRRTVYFDTIAEKLRTPEFLPRALYERFNIEVLATTESPLDSAGGSHRRFAIRAGRGALFPRSGPIRWSIRSSAGFAGIDCGNWASRTARTPRRGRAI